MEKKNNPNADIYSRGPWRILHTVTTFLMDQNRDETRLAVVERRVTKLMTEWPKGARVEAAIEGTYYIREYLQSVYEFADVNNGFYTSGNRTASISYEKQDLILRIAFATLNEARQFVRNLKAIVSPHSGFRVVVNAKIVDDDMYYGAESVIYADDYTPSTRRTSRRSNLGT